ncbi:hypothetical protein KGY64_00855 [Candidatus Bipolaricaulota bacterium]|nr:hypothetical protein [Candidatus Bipolaricaulota bacterium]
MTFSLPAYDAADEKSSPEIATSLRKVAWPPETAVSSFAGGYEVLNRREGIDYDGLDGTCDFNEYVDTSTSYDILTVVGDSWKILPSVSSDRI